jgi:hypothetical protein
MTQGDLVQEALAVAKDQTQALNNISKEVWVSALSSLLFIERRLCIDGVDWLFLFCILLSDWFLFPVIWLDNRPTMVTSDWSDFLVVAWLDTSQSFYHPIIGCPDVTGLKCLTKDGEEFISRWIV